MADLVGGPYELADELHTTHTTLWRWAHGISRPSGIARAFIAEWCRKRGLSCPPEAS